MNNKYKTPSYILRMAILLLLICHNALGQNLAKLDKRNTIRVGKNIHIKSQFSKSPIVEPHISAHPGNNNHLLVVAMVVTDVNRPYQSCRLSSFISMDGGESWEETAHDWWGYDPWSAILPDGNTVMTWLGTRGSFMHQFPLQFFTSGDGGIKWSEKVQSFAGNGHGHDGTKVVALNDEFYYTTVRFNNDMSANVVLYRREGRNEFEEVAQVDGKGIRLNFCEPAILTDGTVIVPSSHYMEKLWVQTYNHHTGELGEKNLVTIRPGGAGGYMRLAADVSMDSKFKDRIYFVRAASTAGRHEGVWLNYSADNGKTWSKDTRIDLFDNDLATKSLVPSIAINSNGVVGISWVDSQNDPQQLKKDVYFSASYDGGISFQRPVRVTEASSNPRTEKNADVARKFPGGGHYLGITSKQDGSFQLIWSDSRNGIFELQTASVQLQQSLE